MFLGKYDSNIPDVYLKVMQYYENNQSSKIKSVRLHLTFSLLFFPIFFLKMLQKG